MMDEEEYEDHLVDRAKELLNEELSGAGESGESDEPGMRVKTGEMDEKAEKDSTSEIPVPWDPREVEHLASNRKKMDNDELEEFLRKNSEFHEQMGEIDEWKGFTRWEERFIIQQHQALSTGEIAEELDRDIEEVKVKMHIMGLLHGEDERGQA